MAELFRIGQSNNRTVDSARSILVVDDSRTVLHVIGRRLTRSGHATLLAQDGATALDMLQVRPCGLVLLDMVMPGMSGLRTLAEIRATPTIQDVPVIMMTARSDPGAVVEALSAGADDHITKPLDFAVLAARIDRQFVRAAALTDLKRRNAVLDARIADRAAENGELRAQLAAVHAERMRLVDTLATLQHDAVRRCS
jgi:two-component system OmpR family response regulator